MQKIIVPNWFAMRAWYHDIFNIVSRSYNEGRDWVIDKRALQHTLYTHMVHKTNANLCIGLSHAIDRVSYMLWRYLRWHDQWFNVLDYALQ